MSRPCPADRVAIGSIRRGSAETPAYLLLAMDLWDCSARSLLDDRNRRISVRRRTRDYLARKPVCVCVRS